MNLKVLGVIANLTLVNRVVISWGMPNEDFPKNMIHHFNYLSRLEEVVLTDRSRLYLIHRRTFLRGNGCEVSANKLALVYHIQQLFCDENRHVNVPGCWFNRD